ncbi:MAG: hypothetical protein KF791_17155 [Verrucomicrobiae bacterium]|nr:hypothetical protein [Verrucomicrobiae bacterium]
MHAVLGQRSRLFFLGAVVGWWVERRRALLARELTVPVASGVIAGGSLMGVLPEFIKNGPDLLRRLPGGAPP